MDFRELEEKLEEEGQKHQESFMKIDVPKDGSCLFWTVALPYLIPVRNDDASFQQRYETLFGNEEAIIQNLDHIRGLFRNLGAADYDDTLVNLVTRVFRNRVVDHIRSHENEFGAFIESGRRSFDDYLQDMRNPNTWGGEPEIRAMSEMLDARISVSGATTSQYGNGKHSIQLFHVSTSGARNHYNFGLEQHIVDGTELRGLKRVTDKRVIRTEGSVAEWCLKTAIKLGYKDVVQVMLGGDIYHCIRLMKGDKFQEKEKALKMIEETVADVVSSWVNDERQSFKGEVQHLLKEGIEVDINKMGKKDLIVELEDRGIEMIKDKKNVTRKELVEKLMEEGVGKVRLSKTIVGALISTLFFNYQIKEPFELKISQQDKSRREKEINELNKKIDSESFVKEKVLKLIQLLNSSSHMYNNWFFREVLAAIVNDKERFNKLKAVCTAICREPMEKLLKGEKVHEDVVDTLKFFGVEIPSSQITTSEISKSSASIDDNFAEDIQKLAEKIKEEGKIEIDKETLVKGIRELKDLSLMEDEVLEIVRGLASNKVPAFSGLSRRTIINLKNKRDKTDDEAKDLKEKVSTMKINIKEGIKIIDEGVDSKYHIDTEDIFRNFKIVNSEIKKKHKREIVELVCQKGNVELLEMICRQEMKDGGGRTLVNQQYSWKGEFTGYPGIMLLLQYVIDNRCSPEIVLCIAKKVYGRAHILYNGVQYFDPVQIDLGEHLKEAIKLALNVRDIDWSEVRFLIKAGGDINTINRSGKTALSLILNFQHSDSTDHKILQNQLSILFSYVVNAENEEQEEIFNMIRSLSELLYKQNINISPLFFEGLRKARDADPEELPNKDGPTQRTLAIIQRISYIEANIVYPFDQQQEPDAQASYAQLSQQQEPNAQATSDSTVPPMSRGGSLSLSSPGGSNDDQPGPSSKLGEVPPILRSQSLNSLHSSDSDISRS